MIHLKIRDFTSDQSYNVNSNTYFHFATNPADDFNTIT